MLSEQRNKETMKPRFIQRRFVSQSAMRTKYKVDSIIVMHGILNQYDPLQLPGKLASSDS